MGLPFSTDEHRECWRVSSDGRVLVWCRKGHASQVMHGIRADGTLYPPPGKKASMHCGHCDEDLPTQLDGWAGGEVAPGGIVRP